MVRLAELRAGLPKPTPGKPGDPGLFGPGSAAWEINARTALLLGGGRALLMQIAHPMVAAGVVDYSGFDRDPWERLWGTLDAVLTVTFGDSERSREAADSVTNRHIRVRGSRGGVRYEATDPDLLLWVHATLVDSALVAYERLIGPLPLRSAERYYEDMKTFASAFGVPEDRLPANLGVFHRYVAETVERLEVSDEARRLTDLILRPPVPSWAEPARALQRVITIGLLPSAIREGFGFGWSAGRARAFRVACSVIRAGQRVIPSSVKIWPHARAAASRAEA